MTTDDGRGFALMFTKLLSKYSAPLSLPWGSWFAFDPTAYLKGVVTQQQCRSSTASCLCPWLQA